MRRQRFLKASLSFLHSTAASMLAGESSFGSESIEMTETRMDSTPNIGRHRSSADSCAFIWSSPGGCRIEMHTTPLGYTFGCHMSEMNVIFGGMLGKSFGNSRRARKKPPSYSVSGGPTSMISQWKMFSSSPRPTLTPSGGLRLSSTCRRRFEDPSSFPAS